MGRDKSAKSMSISNLLEYFKYDDAKDDTMLSKCFIPTVSFKQKKLSTSRLIVGRYGSGKTALIRRIVELRLSEEKSGLLIPIELNHDLLGEELRAANKDQSYGTLGDALLYLHAMYALAIESEGRLVAGDRMALIGELQALDLAPYGDLISRLAKSTLGLLKKAKKIELLNVLGLEVQPEQVQPVDMRRYRQMCLVLEPIVTRIFRVLRPIVVIDALDAPSRVIEELVAASGVLLRRLRELERETEGNLGWLFTMPRNVYTAFLNAGERVPFHDVITEISWDQKELVNLVLARAKKSLGGRRSDDALKEWLAKELCLDFDQFHLVTFGRPRDYIKIVRIAAELRLATPDRPLKKTWLAALKQYARLTRDDLIAEWSSTGGGVSELVSLLEEIGSSIPKKELTREIKKLREEGFLPGRAIRLVVQDLKKWELIREEGADFIVHPLLQESA